MTPSIFPGRFPLPGRRITPLPPRVVFHLPAGNLFLSGIESLVHATLLGAQSIVRLPSRGALALQLWADCLAEAGPEHADGLILARWPRDMVHLTAAAAVQADAVIAFGSDETVAAMRRVAGQSRRYIEHGTRISFAVIGRDLWSATAAEKESVAAALAYDFSVYDQQGCLSPRAAFLEVADLHDPVDFLKQLQVKMQDLARRLPRAPLPLEDAAALARARQEAALEAALGRPAAVHSEPGDPFVLTSRRLDTYEPGCVNRFADIRLFDSPDQLEQVLQPFRGRIGTLGVHGYRGIRNLAVDLRAPRVCALGSMQRPGLAWTHDGRQPLSDLLEWMELPEV